MDYPGHGHGHGGPRQQHSHAGHGHTHGHGEMPPKHYQDMYAGAQSLPGEYSEVHNVMADGRDRLSVSAVAFDTQEEMLWMGNQGGHVTSYYSMSMQKYTSFQVHMQNEIRQILPIDPGILSLTQDTVRCSSRFGQTVYNFNHPALHNMQCMIQTGATNILMGGHQREMVEFDYNTAQELRVVEVDDPGCAILRLSSRYICTGDTSGKVTLRDPNSLKAEHVLPAHSATLSDFDVHGNLLVTCGFSNRERMNSIAVDRYIKVYDLRVMRAVAPLHTQIDSMFLRFVSPYSDKLAVVSQAGQFVMMNTATEGNDSLFMYHVNTGGAPVLSFDVSTSYQSLAFGDGGGYIHLFTSSDNTVFNTYSHHPTFADPTSVLMDSISNQVPCVGADAVLVHSQPMPKGSEKVKGYYFNKGIDHHELLKSFRYSGFQATNFGLAVEEINKMIECKKKPFPESAKENYFDRTGRDPTNCTIFLGYTSNMISAGVRDTIRFLVQHNMVDCIVSTAGGVEEDFIKCLAPTYLGRFDLVGKELRKKGFNRIGNLVVPNDNYVKFEEFLIPILDKMLEEQKNDGTLWTPSKMIHRLGKEIDNPDSVYYWTYKNNIPVYSPALTDGSIGDMLYFHSVSNPGLVLDIIQDIQMINSQAIKAVNSGMLIIGGGLIKHHICNANLMRNGADFSVFVNTASEFDGSDSGARPDEAVSWGKIKMDATPVKVYGEASIIFPLLVAETFARDHHHHKKETLND